MSKRDYYEVLGVQRDATPEQIKKAYRQLALKLHPDRNPGDPNAEEQFKEASEAFAVLSDGQKKGAYDRFGHAGLEGASSGFHDVGDIFSQFRDIFGGDVFGDLFGGRGGRARPDAALRGSDVRVHVSLTLAEAAFGIKKDVTLAHPQPCALCKGSGAEPGTLREICATCQGRGQVAHARGVFVLQSACPRCRGEGSIVKNPCKACNGQGESQEERVVNVAIPAGIDAGQTLRVSGQGQSGRNGGPAGNLFVEVDVEAHPAFQRDGNDLVHELHVTYPIAALGAEVEVPTLEGEAIHVKIPAGIQPGESVTVHGRGVSRLQGKGRGDLIVVVQVDVPKKLSAKAKKLLGELAELMKKEE